jgi:hypothetical protein
MWFFRSLFLLLLLLVTGCSEFQNVLDERVRADLKGMYINYMPERGGQYLRLKLQRFLDTSSPYRYFLKIQLKTRESVLGVSLEGLATRSRIAAKITYELQDYETRELLHKGDIVSYGSYHATKNYLFSNTTAERSISYENLDRLTDLLILELSAYFQKNPRKDATKPKSTSLHA